MRGMVTVVVAGMLMTACGGGSDDGSSADSSDRSSAVSTATSEAPEESVAETTTTSTTVPPATPVADAISIEPAVDAQLGAATVFSPVTDPQPVAVGDTVRTDRTGFAEIAYFDGSFTRLDVDTQFEILELADDVAESTVRTRMGVGRTWHRVESLGEGGSFAVETSVATAVVQGTAFSVACATEASCTFTVVEGRLRIEVADGTSVELVAPAALTVDDDGADDPVPVPWDAAFPDGWLLDNAERDASSGFASAAEVYEAHGPAYASMVGSLTGSRTIVSITCTSYCGPDASEADIGFVDDELSIDLSYDCDAGPCALVSQSGARYLFDGLVYRASIPVVEEPGDGDCSYVPDDGSAPEVTGRITQTFEVTLTPTAAEIRDGVYLVTELAYQNDVTAAAEGFCSYGTDLADFDEYMALPPYLGYTGQWQGTLER